MSVGLCYTLSLLPEALKEKASTLDLSNDKTKSKEGLGFGFRIHGLSHPYTYDQRFTPTPMTNASKQATNTPQLSHQHSAQPLPKAQTPNPQT